MADTRIFKLKSGVTAADTARATAKYLSDKKNLEAEVINIPEGFLIQARQKAVWKKLIGCDNSIQVQIVDRSEDIVVNIGSGEWIDKAGAAAAGMIVFFPLALTAAAGTLMSWLMPEDIFTFIGVFLNSDSAQTGLVCSSCGNKNKAGNLFCGKCGEKLSSAGYTCKQCGAKIKKGDRFCVKCGANKEE